MPGEGDTFPPPSRLIAFCQCLSLSLCVGRRKLRTTPSFIFLIVFYLPVVFLVTFVTISGSAGCAAVSGPGVCLVPCFQLAVSCPVKQGDRCRAKGSQCAPEGFNQLTSQHGNQTCLWIPWEPPSLLTVLSGPQFCMAWIVTGTQSREAPRAAGLQVVATSSGWLIWSGSHQTGHVISQTCIIIISNNGVYSC